MITSSKHEQFSLKNIFQILTQVTRNCVCYGENPIITRDLAHKCLNIKRLSLSFDIANWQTPWKLIPSTQTGSPQWFYLEVGGRHANSSKTVLLQTLHLHPLLSQQPLPNVLLLEKLGILSQIWQTGEQAEIEQLLISTYMVVMYLLEQFLFRWLTWF